MIQPSDVQQIGSEIAIKWSDGKETFYGPALLRAASPSASTSGERDIFGNTYGGEDAAKDFSEVEVTGWRFVGNYAIQFHFSDGHRTGLYSYELLRRLAEEQA